jgi:hypothetical protein
VKKLGYKLTWPTTCFLGCSGDVWAHTNGDGDFVLLDSLGSPWPVHPCYEAREQRRDYDVDISQLERLLARLDVPGSSNEPTHATFSRPTHVTVVDPSEWRGGGPFVKRGLVEFYREKRLEHFTRNAGSGELSQIKRIFGTRVSELGIVDQKGNLFVIFADLRDTVISAGAIVDAEISACRVPIKRLGSVFLCHSLRILPQSRTRSNAKELADHLASKIGDLRVPKDEAPGPQS